MEIHTLLSNQLFSWLRCSDSSYPGPPFLTIITNRLWKNFIMKLKPEDIVIESKEEVYLLISAIHKFVIKTFDGESGIKCEQTLDLLMQDLQEFKESG